MNEGVSFISKDLQGRTREATPFVKQGKGVSVGKVDWGRDVGGGLGSESKKGELVVGCT